VGTEDDESAECSALMSSRTVMRAASVSLMLLPVVGAVAAAVGTAAVVSELRAQPAD
jgi:hypothetical protein